VFSGEFFFGSWSRVYTKYSNLDGYFSMMRGHDVYDHVSILFLFVGMYECMLKELYVRVI
jgi:hypothetical protein